VTYRVQSEEGPRKRHVVHFKRLKPCPEQFNPSVVRTRQTTTHLPSHSAESGPRSYESLESEIPSSDMTTDATAQLYAEDSDLGGWEVEETRISSPCELKEPTVTQSLEGERQSAPVIRMEVAATPL
jgi:hypothetical protein